MLWRLEDRKPLGYVIFEAYWFQEQHIQVVHLILLPCSFFYLPLVTTNNNNFLGCCKSNQFTHCSPIFPVTYFSYLPLATTDDIWVLAYSFPKEMLEHTSGLKTCFNPDTDHPKVSSVEINITNGRSGLIVIQTIWNLRSWV